MDNFIQWMSRSPADKNVFVCRSTFCPLGPGPEGGGVLPYMGYIGMCGVKAYGFSAALVINRVSILAILPPLW